MGFVIVAGGRRGAQEAGRDKCVDQVPQESSAIIVEREDHSPEWSPVTRGWERVGVELAWASASRQKGTGLANS